MQDNLAEMVRDGYITKVEQPTEWVSYMVVVTCKDKIRICIDPRDLKKAIKREHYPMRTIEELISTSILHLGCQVWVLPNRAG